MMKRIVFALLLLASCFGAYKGHAQGTNAESYTDYFKKPDNGNIFEAEHRRVGSAVHFISFYLLYLFIIFYVFAEISRSGHSRHAVTASESHSELQSYRMSHEKALGKTEKVSAEVKV